MEQLAHCVQVTIIRFELIWVWTRATVNSVW